jgi:hypothetical protein
MFKLMKQLEVEERKVAELDYDNFYVAPRPRRICDARVKTKLDKSIANHIIVCGIVQGIENLIVPLRAKCQSGSGSRAPIVILSNDSIGDDSMSADTYVWDKINRFDDIYLVKGSALH